MHLTPREVHVLYTVVGVVWALVFWASWIDAGKTDARERALDAANRE